MTLHLTESERQGAADGSLPTDGVAAVESHLGTCDACAADVGRLRALVSSLRARDRDGAPNESDTWLAIRARIEHRKVVPIAPASSPSARTSSTRRASWIAAGIAAAMVVSGGLLLRQRSRSSDDHNRIATLSAVADSTSAYRDEAQRLLNQLELERAMLRPETAASIDRSLRVVDDAIAELQEALAKDPNNPALRRLLASSYREKVDLLRRVSNAS